MIRILLIDDHTLFRSGVKALLQRQPDFEVVGEASDGLEGVKLVEQVEADVVLLDLDMPSMNGFSTHTFDQGLLSQWPKVAPL